MSSFPYLVTLVKVIYVVCNVAVLVRFYYALRGPGISRRARIGFCFLAAAMSLAFPAARVLDGNALWVRALAHIGNFWFAFLFYAVLAWMLVGLFRLLNWRFRWIAIAEEDRVRWRHRCCAGIVAASLAICVAGMVNMQFPVVREIKLPVPAGTAPLRIVALSDLHLGRLASAGFLSGAVDLIAPLSPDAVLFLGDILEHDFHPSETQANAEALRRLNPRLGIWGVMGNHEYIGGVGAQSRDALNRIGIRTLIDQWATIGEKPGEKFMLIGRKDRSVGRKPVRELVSEIPEEHKDALKILLDHQPTDLKGAAEAGVFLQLSGHVHNGQFFPLNFLVQRLFENAHGYSRRGQTHVWVSSGIGAWGARMRTSGRPEILLIDLVPTLRADAAASS
ncbi:MAG: metallophosphoesterase [Azoarcus sp.]|jgi:predicted MPP superfamily phosphohydrolase|nr:metallophosphoesterase [Azoarcus sp.]